MSEDLEYTEIDKRLVERAAHVLDIAKERKLTLVTAESCTGGLVAAVLSEAPGASSFLHGGFVVYTKMHKTEALGVPADLLERCGAVCAEVAQALAEGALARSPADIAVSVTGVAGPSSDEDGNPVGLVHFGAARRGYETILLERRYGDIGRGQVRYRAVADALGLVERIAVL